MAITLTNTNKGIKHVNILAYGEAGIGKTVMCATAPDPLIISAEGGLLSIAGSGIDVFKIRDRADCNEVYEWLAGSSEARKKYQTICIDSLSEIAEVLLASELKKTPDPRKAYGVMGSEMPILIRGFRDLDFHTYFTAKSKKVVDESTGVITYMPSVPGQSLLTGLPYFFDEVFLMDWIKFEDDEYRVLVTKSDRTHIAKDRSGKLDEYEKPDLTYIFDKILPKRKRKKGKK